MGSWGITALESDNGLDAIEHIQWNIHGNGRLDLHETILMLREEGLFVPPAKFGYCHTGVEALAEFILKCGEGAAKDLDYPHNEVKFSSLSSFAAEKSDLQWVREYLSETLGSAEKNSNRAEKKWGGWFKEADWNAWRERMRTLIGTMDSLLSLPGDPIDLTAIQPEETEEIDGMEMR